MVLYVHSIVHAALKDAMRWNRVARNVANAATRRRSARPGEAGARPGRRRSSARSSTALGLRWSEVDLDRATTSVSRQVMSIDHEIVVKDLPKTKRGHMIDLDSNTVTMLRRWRADQNEEKLLVGPGYVDEGYVFCKPDGTVYDPHRFSRDFIRKQQQCNRVHTGDPLPRHAPRAAPHVGDAGAT